MKGELDTPPLVSRKALLLVSRKLAANHIRQKTGRFLLVETDPTKRKDLLLLVKPNWPYIQIIQSVLLMSLYTNGYLRIRHLRNSPMREREREVERKKKKLKKQKTKIEELNEGDT